MPGFVELWVEDEGDRILRYTCRSVAEAAETMLFLRDFFPNGTFLIQPMRH